MGGKKIQHHTSKEIAMKINASKMKNGGAGGGENGKDGRRAPKEGKKNIFIKCEKCFIMQPSIKSMQLHYEGKHPKETWDPAMYAKEEVQEETTSNTYQQQDYDDYEDDENPNDIEEEAKEENNDN